MSIVAVVNPRSGAGRTARRLPEIAAALASALGDVTILQTAARGDATRLTADALANGATHIVAIGGDGTLNEVVNGFARGDTLHPAQFSFATSGSGGDFRRSFDQPHSVIDAIARLKTATPRRIDIGRVTTTAPDGTATSRLFLNIAGFGLSGAVVERVERSTLAKSWGGPLAFAWHSLAAMASFRPYPVRLRLDGVDIPQAEIATIAICNGRFFGGGMKIAPDADPEDGLFDIVIISERNRLAMMRRMGDIYSGRHVDHPTVRVIRGRQLEASPVGDRAIPMELDGEGGLGLPATIDILPGALTLTI